MLLVRPNGELASARVAKMEAAPARELENVAGDFAAQINNLRARLFQLGLIKDNQRRARAHVGGFFRRKEAAGHSAIIKRDVIGSVIDERPTEKCGEEFLCRGEIARRNFDVIDCVR